LRAGRRAGRAGCSVIQHRRAMPYALAVGLRYLRSKKRATVSVISVIAVTGVALGVAALLAVVSITSGFQEEFRNKVLGVNAHVLVLKYGLNFDEYRDVVARARKLPHVVGAAPFIINEMMLAKGDRLSGVLIKGIDPKLMPTVLDLPSQLVKGSLEGLRRPGARPATRTQDLEANVGGQEKDDLDAYLSKLAHGTDLGGAGAAAGTANAAPPEPEPKPAAPEAPPAQAPKSPANGKAPRVHVPTPAEAEAAMAQNELSALPSDEDEERLLQESAPEQKQTAEEDLPGVVIGATLAHTLGAHVGDRVKVISPLTGLDTSMWKADGGKPTSRDFKVIGIFEAGFQEYDSRLVYMDLYEAQIFQDQGDTVVGVEIRLNDIDRASEIALRLERELGGGPFHTMDWKELNHNLFTALEVQKVMLSLVIATIILVAAFNVIATLIMIVLEKRREVAILKAMGARDSAVLQVFMIQGAAIGLVGTFIGLCLGGAVCLYLNVFQFPLDPKVYLINHLPVRVSPTEFLVTIAIALAICVTATLIPSYWAARLLPADGIRPG
jgi:lipoprotein-releasing system permease protein